MNRLSHFAEHCMLCEHKHLLEMHFSSKVEYFENEVRGKFSSKVYTFLRIVWCLEQNWHPYKVIEIHYTTEVQYECA